MDSFSLTILNIEGLEDLSDNYLYIFTNLNIVRVITLENIELSPIPINKSTLRFLIEDSFTSVIQASVSFKSDIFLTYGEYWLPLCKNSEKTITELPKEYYSPRILVSVQPLNQSPLEEITEDSNEDLSNTSLNNEIQKLKADNFGMGVKIMELEDLLNSQKSSYEEEIGGVRKEFLDFLEEDKEIIEDIEKGDTIRRMKIEIRCMEDRITGLVTEMARINKELEDVRNREMSILKMIEIKDSEIFQLKTPRGLTISREQGLEIKKIKKNLEISSDQPLNIANNKLKNLSINTLPSIVAKTQRTQLEIPIKDSQQIVKLKHLEDLDSMVKKYLSSKHLENYANLSNELIYSFGNSKITIFAKPDGLYYKSDGFFKKLDHFIKNDYQAIEKYKKSLQIRPKTALDTENQFKSQRNQSITPPKRNISPLLKKTNV